MTIPASQHRPDDSKPPAQQDDMMPILTVVRIVWEIGYIIAIPAVVFCFGGAYLDKYAHTSPLFFFIGLALALGLSFAAVIRKVRSVLQTGSKQP